MKYIYDLPNRKNSRLQGYDYQQPGGYFVTICTNKMMRLFGQIVNNKMILNPIGKTITEEWFRIVNLRNNIELYQDEFVLMPNHIHGIVWILSYDQIYQSDPSENSGPKHASLGAIIGQYKSRTSRVINQIRNTPGHSIWQRNYYDHIIRNDKDLAAIRKYILDNPFTWDEDRYHETDWN